jgi:hypothetical protein
MDDDPPTVKPWKIADKQYFQKLINNGKINVTRTDHDYINRVHHKFLSLQKGQLPVQFQDYACSRELEDEISGARRCERGIVF